MREMGGGDDEAEDEFGGGELSSKIAFLLPWSRRGRELGGDGLCAAARYVLVYLRSAKVQKQLDMHVPRH